MMSEIERKTCLFTLRIWPEFQEGNQIEWRGKLQALPDGEAYYFRGLSALLDCLEASLETGGCKDSEPAIEWRGD